MAEPREQKCFLHQHLKQENKPVGQNYPCFFTLFTGVLSNRAMYKIGLVLQWEGQPAFPWASTGVLASLTTFFSLFPSYPLPSPSGPL